MNDKQTPLLIFGHPYSEGQTVTVFGEKAKDLTYDYSDSLMLSDYTKWENSVKQAEGKAPKNSCSWYEAILSNYYDKSIVIEHILFGMDQHNGYSYQVFGYKEAIAEQSDISISTTDKTNSNLNNADKSQRIDYNQIAKPYGLARLFRAYCPALGQLIATQLLVLVVAKIPDYREYLEYPEYSDYMDIGKLVAIFLVGLLLYLVIEFFWATIITKQLFWNNKSLAFAITVALINCIPITYLILTCYGSLTALVFFVLITVTQSINYLLPIFDLKKDLSKIIKLEKMATSN